MVLLATPGFMIEPVRLVVLLACLCWSVLFGLSAVTHLMRWVRLRFWSNLGLEREGIYCTTCRFDVRGATSDTCPECGAHLLVSSNSAGSRLGIMAKGITPPMGYLYRASVYVLVGSFLSFSAVMVVGKLLPINYEPWLYVGLDRLGKSHPDIIVITIDAKRTWTNRYELDRASSWQADDQTVQAFNKGDHRDDALINAIWVDVVSNKPQSLPLAERDDLREEFVAVFRAACDFDEQRARDSVDLFSLEWHMYHRSTFHPWYTALGFIFVITTIIYLLFRAQRDIDKAFAQYHQKQSDLEQRYKQMLDQA